MSDLCHNCGDCHLGAHAIKCRKELRECIICRALGHTYNFCPRSVHQLDEKYSVSHTPTKVSVVPPDMADAWPVLYALS